MQHIPLDWLTERLEALLPSAWRVTATKPVPHADGVADAVVEIEAPDVARAINSTPVAVYAELDDLRSLGKAGVDGRARWFLLE
jgi:hypothetical protein